MKMKPEAILNVKNLRTYFLRHPRPSVKAVDGLSYSVSTGEMVAIVGESGCGKTVGVLSLIRPNPPTSTILDSEVLWHDRDILRFSKEKIHRIRGKDIAMIFQNPLSSLNPLMRIANQLNEVLEIHRGWVACHKQ